MSEELVQKSGLELESQKIIDGLMQEQDMDKTKDLVHLFNINQSKKNVLRAIKYSDLLDKISDQMAERIDKKADNFSNEDLLKYMQALQTSVEKAGKSVDTIDESPAIKINQNNQLNINIGDSLDRESRGRVSEVVKAILANLDNDAEDIVLDESFFKEVEENLDGQN